MKSPSGVAGAQPSDKSHDEALEHIFYEVAQDSPTCIHYESIFPGTTDAWCNSNCFHTPPYCPSSHCQCDAWEPEPSPGPTPEPTPGPTPGPPPKPTPGPTAGPTPAPTPGPTPGPTPKPTPPPSPEDTTLSPEDSTPSPEDSTPSPEESTSSRQDSTTSPEGTCIHYVSIWPGNTDAWCNSNCFHTPPYCPSSHCQCDAWETPTSPGPNPEPTLASVTGKLSLEVLNPDKFAADQKALEAVTKCVAAIAGVLASAVRDVRMTTVNGEVEVSYTIRVPEGEANQVADRISNSTPESDTAILSEKLDDAGISATYPDSKVTGAEAEPAPTPTPAPTPGPTPAPTPGPTPGPTPAPTPGPTPGSTSAPIP